MANEHNTFPTDIKHELASNVVRWEWETHLEYRNKPSLLSENFFPTHIDSEKLELVPYLF